MTYYRKYIKKMIRNLKLEQKIVFTGLLNEKTNVSAIFF